MKRLLTFPVHDFIYLSDFPHGTIIARIAWSYDPSEENNKVFGRLFMHSSRAWIFLLGALRYPSRIPMIRCAALYLWPQQQQPEYKPMRNQKRWDN